MSMKNSNDNIVIRTRNLPACSAVPQPTALYWTMPIKYEGSATFQEGRVSAEMTIDRKLNSIIRNKTVFCLNKTIEYRRAWKNKTGSTFTFKTWPSCYGLSLCWCMLQHWTNTFFHLFTTANPTPVAVQFKAWNAAVRLLELRLRISPRTWMSVGLLWMLFVVRQSSLRRADPSSRGTLPSVCVCVCVCHCVWLDATTTLYNYNV